ncbi:hypothetical protein [Natronomonas amylolytica]|uniref:hypothetical protein n=1 Tax=Natronomonas amylolytica TaxID=3108498 RepID=UPI003008C48D
MALLSLRDQGKVLTNERAEEIGIVTDVAPDEQVAYVEPDPGVTDAIVQGLGFGEADEDDLKVPADTVETITGSELRIRTDY